MKLQRVRLSRLFRSDRAKQGLGGRFEYEVPRFGEPCVCCDAEAHGTRAYNPSLGRMTAAAFPVPVCQACESHALRSPVVPDVQRGLVGGGVLAIAAGLISRDGHPEFPLAIPVIAAGAAAIVGGLIWMVVSAWLARRAAAGGHHRWMVVTVRRGETIVSTRNAQLVSRLLAAHREAHVIGAAPPTARALR